MRLDRLECPPTPDQGGVSHRAHRGLPVGRDRHQLLGHRARATASSASSSTPESASARSWTSSSPSTGCTRSRSCSPTGTSTTPSRCCPVCQARDVPAYIHPGDRGQLADPWSGVGMPPGTPLFGSLTFAEPDDVRELGDGEKLSLGGIDLGVRHAPGHSAGEVVFDLFGADEPVLFSGDVLFAGSIGRVDLPGGSMAAMERSLRDGDPADGRRHRRALRARPVHHHRARARDQPVPGRISHEHQRISRAAAGPALRRAGRARPAAHGLRAARLRPGRDPGGRGARLAAAQGRDREGGLRPAPAARRRRTTTARTSACTST